MKSFNDFCGKYGLDPSFWQRTIESCELQLEEYDRVLIEKAKDISEKKSYFSKLNQAISMREKYLVDLNNIHGTNLGEHSLVDSSSKGLENVLNAQLTQTQKEQLLFELIDSMVTDEDLNKIQERVPGVTEKHLFAIIMDIIKFPLANEDVFVSRCHANST